MTVFTIGCVNLILEEGREAGTARKASTASTEREERDV